jgi:tetratricopeptide (TPR) repeat protein
MKRRAIGLCLLALLFAWGVGRGQQPDAAESFHQGAAAYEAGRYQEAARHFRRAARDIENGDLYFNLGNAYLKAGDLGRAVLWYERAARLAPRDPDLEFNLRQARTRVRDKEELADPALTRSVFWAAGWWPPGAVQAVLALFWAGFWLLLGLRLYYKKAYFGWAAAVMLAASLALAPSAFYGPYERLFIKPAVVLAETLPVKSGPGQTAAELFVLHAGARVLVEDQRNGRLLIRFGPGKIGWVDQREVGLI